MRKCIALAFLLLTACQSPPAPEATPAPAPPQPSAAADKPAAVATDTAAATQALAAPHAGGLAWKSTPPLVARAPKSSMRAAEYGIEGDTQSELSVFYFGVGQGGAVDANIERWFGQIAQADGSDTAKKSKRRESKVGSIAVTSVEARGRYAGGMAMPGAAAAGPIDDAILLGAIAIGPEGPVFFKLVGPVASVDRARNAFDAMIESLHALP